MVRMMKIATSILLICTVGIVTSQVPEAEIPHQAKTALERKLQETILPRIDAENTTLEELIDFLRLRSAELDTNEADATKRGINLVILKYPAAQLPRIKLYAKNITVLDALKQMCESSGMVLSIQEHYVGFLPQGSLLPAVASKSNGQAWSFAEKVIIPRIDFEDVTLAEAAEFIRMRNAEQDRKPDPSAVIVLDSTADPNVRIPELYLRNIAETEVLKIFALMTGHRLRSDDRSVVFYR